MYHHLRGVIYQKDPDRLVVECSGIGYVLGISALTYEQLPELGQEILIYTQPVFRENEMLLFGFVSLEERALFCNLLRVSGVGPALARTILSQANLEGLVQAIVSGNTAELIKMKGLGKKGAERIILELRDRLKNVKMEPSLRRMDHRVSKDTYPEDAFRALIALGLSAENADERLTVIFNDGGEERVEDWVRKALRRV